MQTETANDPNMLRHFSRELPVALQEHELQTYGRMLADKVREEELAEEKKKQVASEHAARIKTIRNEIRRIAEARAKGEELRPVKCAERLTGNVIEIVRLDRHEVVDTRPADLRDLQTSMPGMGTSDLDEGPRGDDLGASDEKPGNVVIGQFGDRVHVGTEDDHEMICDACSEVVADDDELIDYEGSTIHARCKPDDTAVTASDSPVDEDAELDRKLKEREADPDYGGADARKKQEQRDKAEVARLTAEQARESNGKRERSKKANQANGRAKTTSTGKRKR